jgi:transposase-like protein
MESSELSGEELGAYLRREGVHPDQLAIWRRALQDGYDQDKATKRYIGQLEREIRRKDKALAEAAALALLKKKVDAIWGVEDDDTDEKPEK